jgi:hypothetical protein
MIALEGNAPDYPAGELPGECNTATGESLATETARILTEVVTGGDPSRAGDVRGHVSAELAKLTAWLDVLRHVDMLPGEAKVKLHQASSLILHAAMQINGEV